MQMKRGGCIVHVSTAVGACVESSALSIPMWLIQVGQVGLWDIQGTQISEFFAL